MFTKKVKCTDLVPVNNVISVMDQLSKQVTYKIKPDYDISNSNNDVIAHALSCMYLPPKNRIHLKPIYLQTPKRMYFDIIFRPNRVNFYITIDRDYEDLLISKMKTIWNKSEISRADSNVLNNFNLNKTEMCQLVLRDYNFKSLDTSKNNLYPLTNMMGIVKSLKGSEQVRINIAVEPTSRSNWVSVAKDEFKAYKQGKVVDNSMDLKDKAVKLLFASTQVGLQLYIDIKMLLFESVFGILMTDKDEKIPELKLKLDSLDSIKEQNKYLGLSNNTTYKMTSETFKTRITVMSQSLDKHRANINMLSICNNYKDLNADNELVCNLLTNVQKNRLYNNVTNFNVSTSNNCVLSDKEIAKLIQLPQKDLQTQYNIESIDTRELNVPEQLTGGLVRIGIASIMGKNIITTWCQNINIMALAKLFIGPQNAGKTTALIRTVKDCYKANYSNIVIDFIENCQTAEEVSKVIPEKDRVILTLGHKEFIPSLSYNEVSRLITEDMDPWERIRLSNLLAEQVEYLINAVTDTSTGELTAPMLRYLHSACLVAFIHPNAKIADVFNILRRWDIRNDFIRYAKNSNCFDEDDDVFFNLMELHDRDKTGKIVGTRESLIVGVLNRITLLQKNPYLKAMLKADINEKEDFTRYINEGKSIFIKIPQYLFPNEMVRDILTTFYISRIWLTVQMRQDNHNARLCNVIFDEVHQVPTTAKFLSNHVTEFRRHRLGLILTCHYLKQLRDLLPALKSSGASYVLIAGTEKENLELLKEELKPFTVEEGLHLKPHTSINIVNYGNQYAKFITKLPEH